MATATPLNPHVNVSAPPRKHLGPFHVAILGALLLILVYVSPWFPVRRHISPDDHATILVTARLLRQSGVATASLDDDTISRLLIQFGYKDCRIHRYQEEVEACRKLISPEEIDRVRRRIK